MLPNRADVDAAIRAASEQLAQLYAVRRELDRIDRAGRLEEPRQ